MKKVGKERINWPVTILLIAGVITVIFPLYMTVVIALKKPSEMTNDIAGIYTTVITPAIKRIVTGQFILSFPTFFITTVPPSYR